MIDRARGRGGGNGRDTADEAWVDGRERRRSAAGGARGARVLPSLGGMAGGRGNGQIGRAHV